jgi:hypothetical protein
MPYFLVCAPTARYGLALRFGCFGYFRRDRVNNVQVIHFKHFKSNITEFLQENR